MRVNVTFAILLTSLGGGFGAAQAEGSKQEQSVPLQKLDAAALARRIDEHIQKRLRVEQIPCSPRAEDAEYLRRVYLDVHGVIPTVDQARAFLGSTGPDRRA